MLNAITASVAGLTARSLCDNFPCRLSRARGRTFKMGFCIHTVCFDERDVANDRLPTGSRRPFVSVTVGDRSKDTELGEVSQFRGQWSFREMVTLEAGLDEDVTIAVKVSQEYDLLFAALALNTDELCEVSFPMACVLPRLKMEDRDVEGLIYTTEPVRFDLSKDGRRVGRACVSFETRTPPRPRCPEAFSRRVLFARL